MARMGVKVPLLQATPVEAVGATPVEAVGATPVEAVVATSVEVVGSTLVESIVLSTAAESPTMMTQVVATIVATVIR